MKKRASSPFYGSFCHSICDMLREIHRKGVGRMICPKCHYSVRESDLFCGHCGCFLEKAGQGENRSGLSSKEEQEGMLDKFIGIDGRIS